MSKYILAYSSKDQGWIIIERLRNMKVAFFKNYVESMEHLEELNS